MALQKSHTNQSGNVGIYWRVDSINLERNGMKVEARLNLYKSKTDRDDGKRRMDEQFVLVMDIPVPSTSIADLVGAIYTEAKLDPFFAGAIDV